MEPAGLQIHLNKRRQVLLAPTLGEPAEATERFSPAELEQLVKTACLAAFRDGGRADRAEARNPRASRGTDRHAVLPREGCFPADPSARAPSSAPYQRPLKNSPPESRS